MRGADTRQRIKDEAMALFAAQGLDAVSVRDIAAAVGMKPPNLYAHFPSREALVAELFTEGYAAYGQALRDAAGQGGDFATRLDAMVRRICALHDADTARFRFLLLTQHPGLAAFGAHPDNPVELVQALVAGAMAAGEIPPGNAALVTAGIVGLVVQSATFLLYGRLTGGLADIAPDIAAACLLLARRPAA